MHLFRAKHPKTYFEQTYGSPFWIVRYPHLVRLRTARRVILSKDPMTLLDYGAGEGDLLFDAIDSGFRGRIVAYEPVEQYQTALKAKADERGYGDRIELVTRRDALTEKYDLITCLGVLEHMPLPERESFYDLCRTSLSSGGSALIDVPIEVGPTLIVKHFARVLLKGRGKEYDWRALLRYGVGAKMYDPSRHDPSDRRTWIQDHQGFDYRLLDAEIRARGMLITERRSTPLRWLPAPLFNQERFFTVRMP